MDFSFGIGDALGGLLGGVGSYLGAQQTNQANKDLSWQNFYQNVAMTQLQQAYNTQMANTQYQRTTADMRAAGLNPILAAGGFSPDTASASAGSVASPPQMRNALGEGISSAMQGSKLVKELDHLGKSIDSLDQDIENKKSTGANLKVENAILGHEAQKRFHEAGSARIHKENAQEVATDYKKYGPGSLPGGVNLPTMERSGRTATGAVIDAAEKAGGGRQKLAPATERKVEKYAKAIGDLVSPGATAPVPHSAKSVYGGLSHGHFHSRASDGGFKADALKRAYLRSH